MYMFRYFYISNAVTSGFRLQYASPRRKTHFISVNFYKRSRDLMKILRLQLSSTMSKTNTLEEEKQHNNCIMFKGFNVQKRVYVQKVKRRPTDII